MAIKKKKRINVFCLMADQSGPSKLLCNFSRSLPSPPSMPLTNSLPSPALEVDVVLVALGAGHEPVRRRGAVQARSTICLRQLNEIHKRILGAVWRGLVWFGVVGRRHRSCCYRRHKTIDQVLAGSHFFFLIQYPSRKKLGVVEWPEANIGTRT